MEKTDSAGRSRADAEQLARAQAGDGDAFRLVPARANGQPAFGCYISDAQAPIAHAHGLMMLTLAGDRIAGVTRFLDNSLLAGFGLPRTLPDYHPRHARSAAPDGHMAGSPGS